ncbi:MAG: hypothetical protein QOE77_556 [Blastocatellia bacterium]|nr:hypothetical protein [Blastocatellia bacterium]
MMHNCKKGLGAILLAVSLLSGGVAHTFAQHQGHDMPGMSKAKPVGRKTVQKKRKVVRKKRKAAGKRRRSAVKTPSVVPSPVRAMPDHQMPAMPKAPPSPVAQPTPDHRNMPGMMPAHQNPISATPQASPEPHVHIPGMQMPSSSPALSPLPNRTPHRHGDMPMPAASPGAQPTEGDAHDSMNHGGGGMPEGTMKMGPLLVMSGDEMGIRVGSSETNIMSMGQMASGTSWAPVSTPMYMWHKVSGDWLLMLHGEAKIGVNSQGGPRGVTKFESANWIMPMAFHKLAKGTLQLRGMFSIEPFTFPRGGSPLLFQTGETYQGDPLIDRQHPHDLFMELSAQYTHPLGERGTWFAYIGYPGEPALGPPAFMHRASASENPSATLAHHLQDATHISFGVFTTGVTYRWFKLEGSIFNGHEPDEERYDFDSGAWDSRSARLSFAPNRNWAMQLSYGFLRSPEASEPHTDIRRTTASLHYNKPFARGNWASSFIWGRNHATGEGEVHNVNGYTLESTVNFHDRNYLYTRLELVDKNELLRATDRALLGITDDHPTFRIGAFTFGGARDVWNTDKISMAIGSDVTFYSKPAVLDQLYGGQPVSWKLFLRLRPAKMSGH